MSVNYRFSPQACMALSITSLLLVVCCVVPRIIFYAFRDPSLPQSGLGLVLGSFFLGTIIATSVTIIGIFTSAVLLIRQQAAGPKSIARIAILLETCSAFILIACFSTNDADESIIVAFLFSAAGLAILTYACGLFAFQLKADNSGGALITAPIIGAICLAIDFYAFLWPNLETRFFLTAPMTAAFLIIITCSVIHIAKEARKQTASSNHGSEEKKDHCVPEALNSSPSRPSP